MMFYTLCPCQGWYLRHWFHLMKQTILMERRSLDAGSTEVQ